MANTNLKMTVTADTKQATSELSNVVASIAKTTATITAVAAAAKKTYDVCKELVNLGAAEALSQERLKAVLQATASTAGVTYGKLNELAKSISRLTGIEEQQIYNAEKILTTFNALNEEGFARTIQLSADVAMAMGTDMSSAAQKLGQILATPTQGLDGLKEMGVAFTTQEQEQIKAVYEANGAFEAQALILDKVEKAYGKSATAVGNSTANLLTKINETWTDIKTDLGQGLLDTISPALENLLGILEQISDWVSKNANSSALISTIRSNQKNGVATDYSQYTTIELQSAYNNLKSSPQAWRDTAQAILTELDQVISERAKNPVKAVAGSANTYGGTGTTSASDWKSYLTSYGSMSTSYQASQYQSAIDEITAIRESMIAGKSAQGTLIFGNAKRKEMGIGSTEEALAVYLQLGEVVDGLQEKLTELNETAEGAPEDTTISDILKSLGSYSESYQADQLAEQIDNVKTALDSLADSDPAKTYLQEIYDEMTRVEEESLSLTDSLKLVGEGVLDAFTSITSSLSDLWSTQADNLKASMNAQVEAGNLTVAEQEAMQEEIDELNRKSFEANKTNALTNATVSLASTVIGIIEKCKGDPVTTSILTALATASWGAQVASISAQQYTPMATGGIVTGPTHALIGEAGPEAIIPLKDKRAQAYLGEAANPVQINITIQGNADEEVVFNAIERAQKTGLLPSWRYAN